MVLPCTCFTSGMACWSRSFIPIWLGVMPSFAYFTISDSISSGLCFIHEGASGFAGLIE